MNRLLIDLSIDITHDYAENVCFSDRAKVEADDGYYCGDCWYNMTTNTVCKSLLYTFIGLFVIVLALMTVYHCYRKVLDIRLQFYTYYYIFLFIELWIVARMVYLSDAFYNYQFRLL